MSQFPPTAPLPEQIAPRCSNCKFYVPSIQLGDARCRYTPPPAVQRLYQALTSEPKLRIDYDNVNAQMPHAMSQGACSEYKRREEG